MSAIGDRSLCTEYARRTLEVIQQPFAATNHQDRLDGATGRRPPILLDGLGVN